MKNFLTSPVSNAVVLAAALLFALLSWLGSGAGGDVTGLSLGGSATNFTSVQVGDGSVSAPAVSFTNDTDNGLYRIGTNNVGLSAGGVKVLDATASGVSFVGGVSGNTTFSAPYITATTTLQAQAGTISTTLTSPYLTATTSLLAQAATISTTLSAPYITATTALSTAVLNVGGYAQSGAVRFGTASTVISGSTIAHGFGVTPTVFIVQNAVIQAATFTQTLYAYGCNVTSCTVGISEGAVSSFTTVNWYGGK